MLLLLIPPLAFADQHVEGTLVQVWYDSVGTWNDLDAGKGLQAQHLGEWVEWTYYGYPWQAVVADYADGAGEHTVYASSNTSETTFEGTTEGSVRVEGWNVSTYTMAAPSLALRQTQSWLMGGQAIRVGYRVTVDGSAPVTDLRLLFQADPDPDGASGVYTTANDVLDTDGDGLADLAAASSLDGFTMGFGACDPRQTEPGILDPWYTTLDADSVLVDPDGLVADSATAVRLNLRPTLAPNATQEVVFVVVLADSPDEATALWAASADLCAPCDADLDGFDVAMCGGDDCDDTSALAYPGNTETWYDGIDGDCAGGDDYDADLDGSDSPEGGGSDCDDADPTVLPGAAEVWYDGVDQDCDGNDADQDGDGYAADVAGGDDCNDVDPAVSPGAVEVDGDGVDSDCDGDDDAAAEVDSGESGGLKAVGTCGCGAAPGSDGVGLAMLAAGLFAGRRRGPRREPGA